MTKRMRVIIAFVVIELALAVLWYFLASARAAKGDTGTSTAAEAGRLIGETMGTAMGVVAGFFLLLLFVAAKNDKHA